MESESKKLFFTLDRFEGSHAVLTGDKKEFVVPKKYIPKSINEGDVVHITFASDSVETSAREKKAKELLNEILNNK